MNQTLPKQTGRGFTMIANQHIDSLLGQNYSSEALALGIYLIRHIPSQKGTIEISRQFSQKQICLDLGWGPTNKLRFRRAYQQLEKTGFLKVEIACSNTLIFHINSPTNTLKPANEILTTPPEESSLGVVRNPPQVDLPIRNINNKTNLKNHHTENSTAELQSDDDESVENIFKTFVRDVEKPIAKSHRLTFKETYLQNGRPFAYVMDAIRKIAAHPKLHKDTTSINAVWQLPFMESKVKPFEKNSAEAIASCLQNGNQRDLFSMVREQGFCPKRFESFFKPLFIMDPRNWTA